MTTDFYIDRKAGRDGVPAGNLSALRGRGPRCDVPAFKIGPKKGQLRTGTNAGYDAHLKSKETPCDACREAHNDYMREYNAKTGSGRKAVAKFREEHPDRVREQADRYWVKNHDKKLAKGQRYREAHREELSLKSVKHVHQRRARKAGVPVGVHYEREEIFERDGWVCQICDGAIDGALAWPDPMSKSVDHVVEIYKGGADCETNVRAAHLRCNQSRSRS